jgi:tRNA (guanine-N7-)-methyltransferase
MTLDLEIDIEAIAGPIDAETIFGRRAPLVVEIGTGNGTLLAWAAERRPEADFIGIERSGEFYNKTCKRIARAGLTNARCIRAEADEVLERMPPGAIDEVVAYFSDPWPKRRHRARRVFGPEFLVLLERSLRPGGSIVFRTDVGWYFNLTVGALRRRPDWEIVEAGPAAAPDEAAGEVMTNFEGRARRDGTEIWALKGVWRAGVDRPQKG